MCRKSQQQSKEKCTWEMVEKIVCIENSVYRGYNKAGKKMGGDEDKVET